MTSSRTPASTTSASSPPRLMGTISSSTTMTWSTPSGSDDWLLTDMTFTGDHPFVGGQVGGAHGTAGVKFVGADADFGAKAVFAAITQTRRTIDHDIARIDGGGELFGRMDVVGQDSVGM